MREKLSFIQSLRTLNLQRGTIVSITMKKNTILKKKEPTTCFGRCLCHVTQLHGIIHQFGIVERNKHIEVNIVLYAENGQCFLCLFLDPIDFVFSIPMK